MISRLSRHFPLRPTVGGVLLAALTVAPAGPVLADRSGEWQIRSTSSASEVQLSFRYRTPGSRYMNSTEIRLAELDGLSSDQLRGSPSRVSFRLEREAGVFHLVGRLGRGSGTGTWRFAGAPGFAEALEGRGYQRPTEEQQLRLALSNVGLAMVDELAAQRYKRPKTSELVWMADHGVDLAYVRRMGNLGYQVGDAAALVRLRDHGVDPAFVEGLAELGYEDLDMETLVRARDHGVDPGFVRGFVALGVREREIDALVRLRDHGVDPEFVRRFRDIGYHDLSIEDLVGLRDHGVTPEFAEEIAAAGFPRLDPELLKRVRDHGVDGRYIRRARARIADVTIEEVIELRDRGVRL